MLYGILAILGINFFFVYLFLRVLKRRDERRAVKHRNPENVRRARKEKVEASWRMDGT